MQDCRIKDLFVGEQQVACCLDFESGLNGAIRKEGLERANLESVRM